MHSFVASWTMLLAALVLCCGCASTVVPAGDGQTVDVTAVVDASLPPPASCVAATECVWSELPTEINTRADCPCMYGCPNVVVNTATAMRRAAQYQRLCTPGMDGHGHPCGADDCAMAPALVCRAGLCTPSM